MNCPTSGVQFKEWTFIFAIFEHFSRLLYLDSDMLTTIDVAEMFNRHLGGNMRVNRLFITKYLSNIVMMQLYRNLKLWIMAVVCNIYRRA